MHVVQQINTRQLTPAGLCSLGVAGRGGYPSRAWRLLFAQGNLPRPLGARNQTMFSLWSDFSCPA